jgi:hypothetical protein
MRIASGEFVRVTNTADGCVCILDAERVELVFFKRPRHEQPNDELRFLASFRHIPSERLFAGSGPTANAALLNATTRYQEQWRRDELRRPPNALPTIDVAALLEEARTEGITTGERFEDLP